MNLTYETDRLLLRILNENYSLQVLTFLSRNRSYFDSYELAKPEGFYTEEYQKKLLYEEFQQAIRGNRIRFYFFLKDSPQRIIGTVSFGNVRHAFQCCQLGYKLDPLYQHQGYALEAMHCAIPIAARECRLHRIEAYVLPSNQPSIRLLTRLGFEAEGIVRDYAIINRKWESHLQYALLLPDPAAIPPQG